MKVRHFLMLALLLGVASASAADFKWTPSQVRGWEAIFPPGDAIVSLPRIAMEGGVGQIDALLTEQVRRDGARAVLVVGTKTCGPCRKNWPQVVQAAIARPAVPFFDLASDARAADGAAVATFVQYHLSNGLGFGVPAYVLIDEVARPLSPVTNSLSQILGWLDNPSSTPTIGETLSRHDLRDSLGMGRDQLVTVTSSSLGTVLDAIVKATGTVIETSDEVRKMPLDVNMVDMPASQLLSMILPMTALQWASLPARDGRPAVLRLWREASASVPP